MRLLFLNCGNALPAELRERIDAHSNPPVEFHELPLIPSRADLRFLDEAAREVLPVDPTPSLEEIAAQPDVEHLGAPKPPPQQPAELLRVVVAGSDAALGAVLTRMMRGDYLWVQVGFVPTSPGSAAAINWGLPAELSPAVELALTGSPLPVPVIRNDTGTVVAGSASVTAADGGAFEGEIIVDDTILVKQQSRPGDARFFGQFGARLVPTTTSPGIAAIRLTTSLSPAQPARGIRARLGESIVRSIGLPQAQSWMEIPALRWLVSAAPAPSGGADPRSLLSGRALQCGGNQMLVTVDGIPGKRPVDRVTFYRHLRDLQIVRHS
ncbi:hypothetical protein [Corynebacterium doosanense]|uniref:Uncharacterized protein n=1 Tax=Corynebacterium doosanense CAU 212 = DSM 45436 TaxID=558173 RepID=A0A097IIE6_9CORY|nr:hypothetical protein [Corynebacterium doosanense]AIT61907.1 hypothetical protein CDOO_12055 [Corynebacterium doosanense CAU 212 = DSM 45436]